MPLYCIATNHSSLTVNHYILPIDNVSILIHIFIQSFFVSSHCTKTHTYAGETTVMEQVLHGHLTGEVGEHHDTIISTFVSRNYSDQYEGKSETGERPVCDGGHPHVSGGPGGPHRENLCLRKLFSE